MIDFLLDQYCGLYTLNPFMLSVLVSILCIFIFELVMKFGHSLQEKHWEKTHGIDQKNKVQQLQNFVGEVTMKCAFIDWILVILSIIITLIQFNEANNIVSKFSPQILNTEYIHSKTTPSNIIIISLSVVYLYSTCLLIIFEMIFMHYLKLTILYEGYDKKG